MLMYQKTDEFSTQKAFFTPSATPSSNVTFISRRSYIIRHQPPDNTAEKEGREWQKKTAAPRSYRRVLRNPSIA